MLEVGIVSFTTSPSTDVTSTSAGKVRGTPENNSQELSLVDCIAAKLLCPWVLMDNAETGTRVLDTFTLMKYLRSQPLPSHSVCDVVESGSVSDVCGRNVQCLCCFDNGGPCVSDNACFMSQAATFTQ